MQSIANDNWEYVLAPLVAAPVGCVEINESTTAQRFKNYDIPSSRKHLMKHNKQLMLAPALADFRRPRF